LNAGTSLHSWLTWSRVKWISSSFVSVTIEALRSLWFTIAPSPKMSPGPSRAISSPLRRTDASPVTMMYALSAGVFSQMGDQSAGSVTWVPVFLIRSTSRSSNPSKIAMAMALSSSGPLPEPASSRTCAQAVQRRWLTPPARTP
jgi:hypothetical protein